MFSYLFTFWSWAPPYLFTFGTFWIIVAAISIFGLKKVANLQKTAFGDFQGHPGFQTLICARVGGRGNEKMFIENVFSQGGPFSRLVYDENQVINIDWLFNFHFLFDLSSEIYIV